MCIRDRYHGAYALSGSTVQDVFTVPDAKPLDLPAYDFQVERLTCSQLAVSRGQNVGVYAKLCLLYTSPSPRDRTRSRTPSSA